LKICNASRRIFIKLIPVLFLKQTGTGEQFHSAVALAQERGWLELHESGTYTGYRGNQKHWEFSN